MQQFISRIDNRKALQFGQQKIDLHQARKEFEPKAIYPTPGYADICFIGDRPLVQMKNHIISCGVDIVAGPIIRTGATGIIESIYIRDLDGNLIEIAFLSEQLTKIQNHRIL